MKRVQFLVGVSALLFFLAGCHTPGGIIATVDGETVLTTDRLRQEVEIFDRVMPTDPTSQSEANERALALARQLTYEELIRRDDRLHVDATAQALKADEAAQARFGDAMGLQVQLDAYGVSAGEFSGTLTAQALGEAHFEAFLADAPTTASDVDRYLDKHPQEAKLLTCTLITVPTREEAREVKAQFEADPKGAVENAQKYNRDLFDATTLATYSDMAWEDERLPDADVFDMAVGETDIFYQSNPRRYTVVHVDGKKDDRADVEPIVRAKLDRERYLEYVNALAKEHQLRFYEEEVGVVAESETP